MTGRSAVAAAGTGVEGRAARVNLSIPRALLDAARERSPGLNLSALLRDALGAQLELCDHETISCTVCHQSFDRRSMIEDALGAFYDAAHARLSELVYQDGTAEGAMRVLRDVARDWGVSMAEHRPLPRPTRKSRGDALASKLRMIDAPPAARRRAEKDARRREVG